MKPNVLWSLVSIGRIYPWGGVLAKESIIVGRAINLVSLNKNLLLWGHCPRRIFEDLRCNSVMDVKLQLWQMILSNVLSRISKSSTFSNNFLVSVSFKMKNAPFVFVNYTWKLCMANLVWQLSLWNNEWVISWFTKRFIFFILKFFRVFFYQITDFEEIFCVNNQG